MKLAEPRIENHRQLSIAGLRLRRLIDPAVEIPALWQRLGPNIGRVPGEIPGTAFGLCMQSEGNDCATDYVAGCEVDGFAGIAPDWARVTIPPQRYAIFAHPGAATQLQESVRYIFDDWLPQCSYRAVAAGSDHVGFFERYGPGFDPHTGRGDIELWVPIGE